MAQTLRLPADYHPPRVDDWFNQEAHPRPAVLAAQQSQLPGRAAVVHQRRHDGTSMMHTGRDSLAGMTTGDTASSSVRAPTVAGHRGTSQQRILEPDQTGALQVPPIRRPVTYQCTFWFLRCLKEFDDEGNWQVHMKKHFGSAGPPPTTKCCFCGKPHAWKELLKHLRNEHFILGHRIGHSRPDFELINYLKDRKIITGQDWKDLQGTEEGRSATANLSGQASMPRIVTRNALANTPYTVTHNRRNELRQAERRR